VIYQDVAEAMAWLRQVVGFVEHCRYGEPIGVRRRSLAIAAS